MDTGGMVSASVCSTTPMPVLGPEQRGVGRTGSDIGVGPVSTVVVAE